MHLAEKIFVVFKQASFPILAVALHPVINIISIQLVHQVADKFYISAYYHRIPEPPMIPGRNTVFGTDVFA